MAKLLYMHMLGYPTHFGQMEALKLIASLGFPEKRLGYLGLMLLLDERQEVLMLVTNSLKNDLHSRNQLTQGLALCALGNICSAEMARDLAPEVEALLSSHNPYLRKKAALCARRVLRKVPDLLEPVAELAPALLEDRNHGVLLSGVSLMLDICAQAPAMVAAFRPLVPRLCALLRSLTGSAAYVPDVDVGGLTDPFLQVKLLRLLRVLGRGDAAASDAMGDVLAAVASATETQRTAGHAVLYECVLTILAVESVGGLRVMAVNALGRFLAHKDNNIRFVALHTLALVAAADPAAVQRHRGTVVECVRDGDASIRGAALELVYALVNEANVRALTAELLDYLERAADRAFRPQLAEKICALVAKFAPDTRWYVDAMAKVLSAAGDFVRGDDAVSGLIRAVNDQPAIKGYAARMLYAALAQATPALAPEPLACAAAWCVGEAADQACVSQNNNKTPALLDGEPRPLTTTPEDLLGALRTLLTRPGASEALQDLTLTALAKLAVRLPELNPRAAELIGAYQRAPQPELQTRAVEYTRLERRGAALAAAVLEPIPPMDGEAADATTSAGATASADALGASSGDPAADLAALLGLDDGAAGAPVVDPLAALTGGGASSAAPARASAAPAHDPLADLFGTPAPSQPSLAVVNAFNKDGVRVTMEVKPSEDGASTELLARVSASAPGLTDWVLQAAVPRFATLRLSPPSGTAAAPGADITQRLHVVNSQAGKRPLVLRLRLKYRRAGREVLEQAEVSGFPSGV